MTKGKMTNRLFKSQYEIKSGGLNGKIKNLESDYQTLQGGKVGKIKGIYRIR